MRTRTFIFIISLSLFGVQNAVCQTFTNLDFESANLSLYSSGPVPVTDAIPGWTAYAGTTALMSINYNLPPPSGGVDILGTNGGYHPFQGNYYVWLLGDYITPVSIVQTGTIPSSAQSMTVLGTSLDIFGVVASFDEQPLTLISLGSHVYVADISAYAGQTGELRFTSDDGFFASGIYLDNIQFSDQPIPEPGTLGLLALGGLGLFCRRRQGR